MSINDLILVLVVVFFGLLLYAIHRDEKRKADRRQQDLPHPVERRVQDRRRKGLPAYLAWGARTLWSKLIPHP